jgi:hypothetical protein
MTETAKDRSSARSRYAGVLDQCRDMALVFADSQLTDLFENAGAALLDFAERAENNTIQGRFFEAMGLIQRRRPDIEHQFRQEIAEGFDNFGKVTPPSREAGVREEGKLSLVEPDEMEETVATENLVIRANASFFPELYALSQRLTVVNDGRKLKESGIPAGPHHLVRAFRRSLAALDVEVRIKVILYALFEKYVIKQAKDLYEELNGSLKGAGILPNLKPVHVRHEHEVPPPGHRPAREPDGAPGGEQSAGAPPENQEAPSLGTELFESILDLMSSHRSGRHRAAGKAARPAVAPDPSVAAAESRQLVSAIDRLQAQTTTASVSEMLARPGEIPNLEIDTAFVERVKETLSREREQVLSQIDRDKLSPVDADLIDLIGMLFEYMLNDPVLPNLAKALLSHLHTPYLKVALIDRRLLVDARHPARRLLDQMVEAGSLWVDENNPHRGIFPVMQRLVDRVLQEFADDVSLFKGLLDTFEQAMREQQRRTDTMEQRTQEAARGREKLQLAKRQANHQIQRLVTGRSLPKPVVTFLTRTWLDQLVFILLRDKHGDRGDAWAEAVKTGEDLIALFDPRIGSAEMDARKNAIPDLQERISQGVRRMGSYTHTALESLFSLLNSPDTFAAKPSAIHVAHPVAAAAETEATESALTPGEIAPDTEAGVTEQEQEVIARLRKMKFGTWFEFSSQTGGAPRRIKLSWLSPLTATCMFVDRSGMQAEIKTLHELAQEILSGHAKVIPRPKHPFIERALVSIRKMLQGEEESSSAEAD